nr:MAG: hypothetical protein [Bacteriophage sp.]
MSKEITIPVPDGKRAEWINGVLTLVDEPKVDNRPVTERIKTFEDAREALGDEHPLVKEYWGVVNVDLDITQDLIAYLKLRIIVAALNEGWEPKFEKGEYRYFPRFYFYTKEEYDKLDDEVKGRCVLRSGYYTNSYYGFELTITYHDASYSFTCFGSRLAFRTRELAAYAGRQFIEEWADFMFKPRTGEELNGKSEAAKTTIDFNNNEDE